MPRMYSCLSVGFLLNKLKVKDAAQNCWLQLAFKLCVRTLSTMFKRISLDTLVDFAATSKSFKNLELYASGFYAN